MPMIGDLLNRKQGTLHSVPAGVSVLEATRVMNQHKIGALVVTDDDRIVGIFTERDVLRRIVAEERSPADVCIADVMTSEVLCCRPETPLEEAQSVMKHRRVRHLPVVDDDGVAVGMISIGDLNALQCDDQEFQLHYLHDYLFGRV